MKASDSNVPNKLWRTLAAIFVVAVGFNYVWELAQSPRYVGMSDFSRMLWHCFAPSLGDGLLVLLIYATGWLALRQRAWFVRPGVRGYALMLGTGFVIAVSVELMAVYVLGRWEYNARMPLLPGLGIGLLPIAQMLLLPPIIFRVVAVWLAATRLNSLR